VVLTGGGAELPGTAELARDVFGASVRVGRPLDAIVGLREALDTPREATVAGLTLYGASRLAIGNAGARRRGASRSARPASTSGRSA
jgi:cell division protein FtsA